MQNPFKKSVTKSKPALTPSQRLRLAITELWSAKIGSSMDPESYYEMRVAGFITQINHEIAGLGDLVPESGKEMPVPPATDSFNF